MVSGIVALTYHDVVVAAHREQTGLAGPTAARYKLDPADLEAHLDAIAATGARVGIVHPDAGLPEVAITFDDGGASALAAADAVERRGWRAHFFVTTARIGTRGFLDADGVRDLARRGHVVGSHSHTHPTFMGHLSPAEIEDEWRRSRAVLADVIGTPPLTASVPGGFLSRAVVTGAAAAGYRVLMTSEPVARARQGRGLVQVGRFTVWASTPAGRVAAYVEGTHAARARLWAGWNAKKLIKRSSPAAYEILRHRGATTRRAPGRRPARRGS
jgi:peptidoglycan/xylan/chitin deacetylase (PgdA/CDA1 family)